MKRSLIGGKKRGKRKSGAFLEVDTSNLYIGLRHMDLDIGEMGSGVRHISHYLFLNLLPCLTLVIFWHYTKPDTEDYGDLF